jgi:hypothetical protein
VKHFQPRSTRIYAQHIDEPGAGGFFVGFVTASDLDVLDSGSDNLGFGRIG